MNTRQFSPTEGQEPARTHVEHISFARAAALQPRTTTDERTKLSEKGSVFSRSCEFPGNETSPPKDSKDSPTRGAYASIVIIGLPSTLRCSRLLRKEQQSFSLNKARRSSEFVVGIEMTFMKEAIPSLERGK
ncbi:Hypothetical protein NTJ_04136 [Nesidiocoris tenuis]|uniref:Uncharacterized protein n=1 Tax=Nesidiocoris tenuis TaxID=355587 RepID=A0ABN7AHA4_9HEMI|nr:Hypothetical protein NTJ_04136 [Nesidiocoris tenuis]